MRFSIVTISYNQATFLEEAILSVISQDYPEIEYIIVDPGSSDGSIEIIEKYRERIAHIIYEPDKGPADGLNKGFKKANGDIFGFLNADDLLLPGAVNQVANQFELHPQVDVLVGNGKIIDQDGNELRKVFSDKLSLFFSAYGASIIIQPSTFFRKSAFQLTNGFNPINRSNWDDEFFIDMKSQGAKFKSIDAFLSCYRLHPLSVTGSKKLNEKTAQYNEVKFKKIMGRSKQKKDYFLTKLFRILRHIINYRDSYERIRKGPIYGRYENK